MKGAHTATLDTRVVASPVFRGLIDEPVEAIRRLSEPGDVILDLIMPGTSWMKPRSRRS